MRVPKALLLSVVAATIAKACGVLIQRRGIMFRGAIGMSSRHDEPVEQLHPTSTSSFTGPPVAIGSSFG